MFLWWTAIVVILLVCIPYFLEYRDWADWNKRDVLRVAPGPCKTVIEGGGSEDLLHIGNNKLLITRGLNYGGRPGHISLLDLDTNKVKKVDITNAPNRADFMAGPHGLTSWRDPETGQLFIYVVTHLVSEDRVEVFEVSQTLTLTYIKTITDPSFTLMNDLVAVGKDKFYITASVLYRQMPYMGLEVWLRLRNGRIVYYDGHKGREVATGYFMANGINMSPDMSTIYMAESGYKTVHAFKRDELNNLHHLWAYNTQTVVDNIDIDPATGDLWIGSHPVLWKVMDAFQVFGATPPSQVIRLKLRDNMVSGVELIYSDNGEEIVGSTVAAYVNGKLVIGSIYSTTLVCDVKYLSP